MCVTVENMRLSDKFTIENGIVSVLELMLRAGDALSKLTQKIAATINVNVIVLCGKGNNGGDGYACADLLLDKGYSVDVFAIDEPNTVEARYYRQKLDIEIGTFESFLKLAVSDNAIIVDCIFGTGIKGQLKGVCRDVIIKVNKLDNVKISCDMPSGLNDNGRAELAINSDYTLAIQHEKTAYYLNDGMDYTGEIVVCDIGIVMQCDIIKLTNDELIEKVYPKRKRNCHKGDFGKACIVACSENYVGAGVLSAVAAINTMGEVAMRAGAGICKLAVPNNMVKSLWERVLNCSIISVDDLLLIDADSYAYGMGIGGGNVDNLQSLINSKKPLVIDADGLNLLAKNMWLLDDVNVNASIVLTPHVKEMSRLTGKSVDDVLNDPIRVAQDFATKYGLTILLKGAGTVVTDGKETYINICGSPCQAKGGSGDVLSGIIVALLAKHIVPLKAAAAAIYIMGQAAKLAVDNYGENGVLASDVAKAIKMIIDR